MNIALPQHEVGKAGITGPTSLWPSVLAVLWLILGRSIAAVPRSVSHRLGSAIPIRCSQRKCDATPDQNDSCSLYLTPNS